jgi:hypothetical protein
LCTIITVDKPELHLIDRDMVQWLNGLWNYGPVSQAVCIMYNIHVLILFFDT